MRLIILAAGKGERLRPYTNEIPKCMVNLAGHPLLSYQLSSIKKCNISQKNIAIVGGYKMEALDKLNLKKFKNIRYASTNMVTTLFCARDFMKCNEDLLIAYGDIIYESKVLETVMDCDNEMCVAADIEWERLWRLRMSNPLDDAESFIMDDKFLIKGLGKKPVSFSEVQAQYIGLIKIRGDMVGNFIDNYDKMNKSILYDGQNFENMYMTSFIQYLIDIGWQAKASLVSNGWLEIDTAEDLECYNQMAIDGSLNSYCQL